MLTEHFAHRNFNPFQSTYKNIFSNFVSSENPPYECPKNKLAKIAIVPMQSDAGGPIIVV